MISDDTLNEAPVPAFDLRNDFITIENTPVVWWLKTDENDIPYYLEWHGNGFVIRMDESYFCKDQQIKHRVDIKSFQHSNIGAAEKWEHVFNTKEEALNLFSDWMKKTFLNKDK
jgi:hypothetical protein